MKKIHLVRHAKSSWKEPVLPDIGRPLNKRGINSCQFMAEPLLAAGCNFNHILCSSAVRAQQTIELLSEQLPFVISWHTDEQLYCFDKESLIQYCEQLDDSIKEVMLIGHNPAFTDFTNFLSGAAIDNIPTCGYVQLIDQQGSEWHNLKNTSFELAAFVQPKDFE